MPEPIITVLDTTIGETGPTQTTSFTHLKEDVPLRFSALIAAGDTVVVEGRLESTDTFETLYTFTEDTPIDIYLMRFWRVRRSIDGAAGDSTVKVQNLFNAIIDTHAA